MPTGVPLTPRCVKCFRRDWERDAGVFTELTLTGQSKRKPAHGSRHGSQYNVLHVQVQCGRCKRIFWSRHPALQYRFNREFGKGK